MPERTQLAPERRSVALSRDVEWVRVTASLGGEYTGGRLVERAADFSADLAGLDEPATSYRLDNWVAGITSGALYAFRSLGEPRRRLVLHKLDGLLRASDMQALANATAICVAGLCGRDDLWPDLDGWRDNSRSAEPAGPPRGGVVLGSENDPSSRLPAEGAQPVLGVSGLPPLTRTVMIDPHGAVRESLRRGTGEG